jgi:hypothetical protein
MLMRASPSRVTPNNPATAAACRSLNAAYTANVPLATSVSDENKELLPSARDWKDPNATNAARPIVMKLVLS